MKLEKDRSSGQWLLTSAGAVLYRGRRSPWEAPSILVEAAERERRLGQGTDAVEGGRPPARGETAHG